MRLTKQCLEDLERDPKRFVPRGIHAQISNAKNQLIGPADYMSRVDSFYDQTVAEVYELYQKRMHAANAMDFDDLLMLTVEVLERFPEALAKLAEGVPVRAGRRVPGHEPRAVPAAPAARRQAPEPDGRRRSRPVDLRLPRRRHPQHSRVREGLPGHAGDPARAELPLDEHDPEAANARHPQQPRAQGEEPLVGARRGPARCTRSRSRTSTPRRGSSPPRSPRSSRRATRPTRSRSSTGRTRSRRVLEDVLVRQGIAYQVIGGPRFYERAEIKDLVAYLQVIDNPFDADLAAADREPAEARHRRRDALAAAGLRRRPRDLAVRVARLPGGGRRRRPRRLKNVAALRTLLVRSRRTRRT